MSHGQQASFFQFLHRVIKNRDYVRRRTSILPAEKNPLGKNLHGPTDHGRFQFKRHGPFPHYRGE